MRDGEVGDDRAARSPTRRPIQIEGRVSRAQVRRYSSPPDPESEGISVDEIRFLGDGWVLYRSTLRGQRLPKAGGDPVPFATKYLDLLRRGEDGKWQVSYRMWNDNG
jgi:hypothetical protein